jgi:hypothetical protein
MTKLDNAVSRRCHKLFELWQTTAYALGQLSPVRRRREPSVDAPERTESTSEAEYAGSIPVIGTVIGSTLTSSAAVRTVRTPTPGITAVKAE